MTEAARIVPQENELTAPFWESAYRGQLLLQRCLDCGRVWHPPAPTCAGNPGHRIEWFTASGRGALYSYTQVEHSAHPAVTAALPYVVALIDLEEGPRLICNLVQAAPAQLRAGLAVMLEAGLAAGGLGLLVARPARTEPVAEGEPPLLA